MVTKEDLRMMTFTVNDAINRALEGANEKWITAEALCEQFQCFSPSWLKRFGKHLNPIRAEVYDKNKKHHKTCFVYPMYKIQRLIRENKLVFYEDDKVQYRSSSRA